MAKPYIYPKCQAAEDPRVLDLITQLSYSLQWRFTEENFKKTIKILEELAVNEIATYEQCHFLCELYDLDLIGNFADFPQKFFGEEYPKRITEEAAAKLIREGKLKAKDLIDEFLCDGEDKVFRDPIGNHPIPGIHRMFQKQYNTIVAAVCKFLSLEHSSRENQLIYVTPPDGPAMLVDEDFYFGMSQDWCWHMFSPCEFITYCREYNAYIPDFYAIKQFVINRQNTPREELMNPKIISSEEYYKLSEEEKFAQAFPDPADKDRDKAKTYAIDISEETYNLALARKTAIQEQIKNTDDSRFNELQLELTVWADIVDAYDAVHDRDDNEILKMH